MHPEPQSVLCQRCGHDRDHHFYHPDKTDPCTAPNCTCTSFAALGCVLPDDQIAQTVETATTAIRDAGIQP